MKTIKFSKELVPLVLSGEKTSTWRLFDDKNLSEGDELEFVNKDTSKIFGHANILSVSEKKLGEIGEGDFDGHEKFEGKQEMIEAYKGYYGDRVNVDTVVKIIKFSFNSVISVETGIQSEGLCF